MSKKFGWTVAKLYWYFRGKQWYFRGKQCFQKMTIDEWAFDSEITCFSRKTIDEKLTTTGIKWTVSRFGF